MKLLKSDNTLEANGIQESIDITLKVTSKAFKILTTTNYSRPIEAIIRELSCNAVDAHVDAGNPEPIVVHMPTEFEPWFSVRDNGVGMSQDDIINIYSVMFESNKTESNEFTGALGIGSKSPLAYTDQFEVISRYNGMTYTYIVFIDEQGMPKMAKLHEGTTTDRNGVEVKVTVQSKDFKSFNVKARDIFKYFDTMPTLVNYDGTEIVNYKDIDTNYKGDRWRLPVNMTNKLIAIQGNVAYPVQLSNLNLGELQNIISNMGIIIRFDIGELNFASSREELHYDGPTISNIEKEIHDIRDTILKKCNDILDLKKSKWELFRDISVFTSSFISSYRNQNSLVLAAFANTTSIDINPILHVYASTQGEIAPPKNYGERLLKLGYRIEEYTYRGKYGNILMNLRKSRDTLPEKIAPSKNFVFFFNDVKKAAVSRMRNANLSFQTAFLITQIDDKPRISRTHLMNLFGGPKLHLLSEQSYEANTRQTGNINVYVNYMGHSIRRDTVHLDDLPSGGYFYYMKDSHVIWPNTHNPIIQNHKSDRLFPRDGYRSVSTIKNIAKLANQHNNRGIDLTERHTLIGVTKTMYKNLSMTDGWYPLFDDFDTFIAAHKKDIANYSKIQKNFVASSSYRPDKILFENSDFIKAVQNLPTHSYFRRQVRPLFTCYERIKKNVDIINAVEAINSFKISDGTYLVSIPCEDAADMEELLSIYPFIECSRYDFTDIDFHKIITPFFKQIEQIDELRK